MKGNNLINFIIALQFWPFLFSGKKATNKNENIMGEGGVTIIIVQKGKCHTKKYMGNGDLILISKLNYFKFNSITKYEGF